MIPTVHVDRDHRGQGRYTLTDTGSGRVWGVCAEVEGLFREPLRGTYELFGWVPDGAEVRGWVGSRIWLVPEDRALDAWLLEDAESLGQHGGADGLVLTGLDDYEGPPEGHRAPVRLHDGYRWLGSCREFARVLPPEQVEPPLVLRWLAPSDRLRRALATGTRRTFDLEEAWLEIRDDRGEPLTDRLLRPKVRTWQPSSCRTDLIDLELDGYVAPVPGYAQPVWERWLTGPRTRQALGPRSRPVSVGPGSISSGSGAVGSSTRTGSPGTRTSWTAGTSRTNRASTWHSARPSTDRAATSAAAWTPSWTVCAATSATPPPQPCSGGTPRLRASTCPASWPRRASSMTWSPWCSKS